jgi:hypothetical protein
MKANVGAAKPMAITGAALLLVALSPVQLTAQPVIVVQPKSQAVPLGEDVLFTVSAAGASPLGLQWRFNGTNLPGATSSNLYFASVNSNIVGNYSVQVSNLAGAVLSSNAALTLLPPPVCVEVPSGVISWWPADGSTQDVIGTNDAVDLRPPFFPPSSGYTSGKVGLAFETDFFVPDSPSLNFGINADFSIEAWIKVAPTNGFILRNMTNLIIVQKMSSPLLVPTTGYAFELDNGRLACRLAAAGPGGVSESGTFISAGPDLRDYHFHHVALTLHRSATNGGNLYVDGQTVLTFNPTRYRGDLSNMSQMHLGISPGSGLPPGIFDATDELAIYNRALTATEILSIRQAGSAGKCKLPPTFSVRPADQRVTQGSNAMFTVSATSTGSLRYQWRFNGTNFPAATNAALTLPHVQDDNAGLYSVRVTNVFGSAISSNALLIINHIPVAVCTNVVASADADCLANASVDGGSYDPDGDALTIVQSPPGPYALGTNLVALTVTDPLGASSKCAALVTVVDTTPPTLTCPVDITVEFNTEAGTAVFFTPQATDNCTAVVPITCVPASGSTFDIGTTPVHCTATDDAGNSATCGFQVMVLGAQGVISNVLVELSAISAGATNPPDGERLDQAISRLSHSLEPSLWLDQTHLEEGRGGQAFNEDKAAVQDLRLLMADESSLASAAELRGLITRIARAERLLAMVAIHDAGSNAGKPKQLAQALEEVTKGDTEVAGGQYEAGIAHYRNGWKRAYQASPAQISRGQAGSKSSRF